MQRLSIIIVLVLSCNIIHAQGQIKNEKLRKAMNTAWSTSWKLFYHPKTNQFYDFITSYKQGRSLEYLPKPKELRIQIPNFQGYGTGMEDCMISAGVLLDMLVDKYLITKERSLIKSGDLILRGIERSSKVHGVYGFLARGVSPYATNDIYINSSRDQYTHVIHGLWKYYQSPLATESQRERIKELVVSYAERMKEKIVKETNYDFQRANNTPDVLGISRMWYVDAHEAARLPMFYAVAWKMTNNSKYLELMNVYLIEAIRQSFKLNPNVTTYAMLQMQNSMEVLYEIVDDIEIKKLILQIFDLLSEKALGRLNIALNKSSSFDHSKLVEDWRKGIGIRPGTHDRNIWYNSREVGEALLTILMNPFTKDPLPMDELKSFLSKIDFHRISSNGIYYLQGAYWKALRLEKFN